MQNPDGISRRSLLKQSSLLGAGASAFSILRPRAARAAGSERLKAGLVGCGGRGTQAVVDLLTGNEQVELTGMADVFEDHLEQSLVRLRDPKFMGRYAGITVERNGQPQEMTATDLVASIQPRIRVEPDHHFTGFDAYKKLLASDIDIVMLCTPPGFRPMHFEAAVNAGKHVFTEKPIATDPVGARRFIAAGKLAAERKLTVVSGAQRHAHREYVETVQKIHDGAIGEINALYAYYLSGPVFHADRREPQWSDMEWQLRNWYSFIWICGDQIVEQHFHNIDFMNWLMGAHPERVVASGGAAWRPREPLYGNIYDHMSSDFVYPNGVHLSSHCRQYPKGVYHNVSDLIVGAKGRSNGMDMGAKGINPYVQEHINMIRSIRGDGPYLNYSLPVAESTLTAIMGRESAYSGQEVTWDQIMQSQLDLMPKEFGYDVKMEPAPLPVPGTYKFA
ncbi:MAG TPA: Gfo/Idh/MocA family oxidoreductase [Bryobacteraceae bacterium]|nr:Gfo/Idh/MocA family oxidoreductase [Bryobacteraceae bacterium]